MIKKVIIRCPNQYLTDEFILFGNECVSKFRKGLKPKKRGEDWPLHIYKNEELGLSGYATLNKNGTISVSIHQSVAFRGE